MTKKAGIFNFLKKKNIPIPEPKTDYSPTNLLGRYTPHPPKMGPATGDWEDFLSNRKSMKSTHLNPGDSFGVSKKASLLKNALSPEFLEHASYIANKKGVKELGKKVSFDQQVRLGKYNNQMNSFLNEANKRRGILGTLKDSMKGYK